jgi:hypothetical protein
VVFRVCTTKSLQSTGARQRDTEAARRENFKLHHYASCKKSFSLVIVLIFFPAALLETQTGSPRKGKKMTPSPNSAPFASAHNRARTVKILLIVGVVATFLSILAEALSLSFPALTEEQEFSDNPGGVVVVMLVLLFAILDLIIYFATVVLFVMWLHRSYSNLRAFDPSGPLDYSPGWAAGSFFIPFANLIIPYRAIREVWQKSAPPDDLVFAAPKPPVYFPVWWLFWLLASIAGNISMRASFNDSMDPATATMTSITASALAIVAAFFAYLVVDSIDKRQQETSEKINLGRFAGPPPPPANLQVAEAIAPAP